ncbi:unnamed protein product [Phytophthora lilii]|uniref:Unnamed protein product n=1 Tax=Phytophthora lilii TaxID=2077276 RepID=A0A9W6TMH1_9STRA|nr:unnamed protein product [Phytophthora lilii]
MFQLLSRAIVPLPSGMDIGETQRSWGIVSLEKEKNEDKETDSVVTSFAFDGKRFGNDRSVRANVPFPASFYIAVFKRRAQDTSTKKESFVYQIGATESGYFEISISEPTAGPSPHSTRNSRVEMTAIGLVPSTFPLVGKQPGWTNPSFGYHGDNGKLYSAFPVTSHVSAPNGVYGANRYLRSCCVAAPYLPGDGRFIPCIVDHEWFPAVGLDSPNTVHVNFGQQPFLYDHVIGKFFCLEKCGTLYAVA